MANSSISIGWAFDPFTSEAENQMRDIQFLNLLAKSHDIIVTPCYVVGADIGHWVEHAMGDKGTHDIVTNMKKLCESKIEDGGAQFRLHDPKIVIKPSFSLRKDVTSFLEAMSGYDYLITNAHNRGEIETFFLGSFAESLLLSSKRPVIVIPPGSAELKQIEHFLYPSNLSKESEENLFEYLESPANFCKKVDIYSKVSNPISVYTSGISVLTGGSPVSFDNYMTETRDRTQKKGDQFATDCGDKGVEANFVMDEGPFSIAEGIHQFADRNKCDLIAMPSFADSLETLLIGSITREVVRTSKRPVLVWPRLLAKN